MKPSGTLTLLHSEDLCLSETRRKKNTLKILSTSQDIEVEASSHKSSPRIFSRRIFTRWQQLFLFLFFFFHGTVLFGKLGAKSASRVYVRGIFTSFVKNSRRYG